MAEIILTNVSEEALQQLQRRAINSGLTPEAEASAILMQALQDMTRDSWSQVDSIYAHIAASGQVQSDSAQLLREDRDR